MAFDFWRFMQSPSKAVERTRRPGKPSNRRTSKAKLAPPERPRVPWWISICFFIGIVRVLLGTLTLLGFSVSGDEQMPAWFNWLLIAHGAAMIVALVFILNGFGWARLALLILALAQLAFDQGYLTKFFLLFDAAVLIVLLLPRSAAYFAASAAARVRRDAD